MIRNKKQMVIILGLFVLVLALISITYAFFNYTRTGEINTVRTGNLSFSFAEGNAINLTNVYPISSTAALTDSTNTGEVIITISGDTNYTGGIEYLVTIGETDIVASNETGYDVLVVPIDLVVTPEVTGDLGVSTNDYWNDRGGNTSYYSNIYTYDTYDGIYSNKRVLVGYIAPGASGINATIGIKAYINSEKIAISDTYDEYYDEDFYGAIGWKGDRVLFSTNEWNTLSTNGVSFKIKVEANEGIWVPELRVFESSNHTDVGGFTNGNVVDFWFISTNESITTAFEVLWNNDRFSISFYNGSWSDGSPFYLEERFDKFIYRFTPEDFPNILDEEVVIECLTASGICTTNLSKSEFISFVNAVSS